MIIMTTMMVMMVCIDINQFIDKQWIIYIIVIIIGTYYCFDPIMQQAGREA